MYLDQFYRYDNFNRRDDTSNGVVQLDNTDQSRWNRYKVGLNLSSKVNDYVKFNSRFIVGGGTMDGRIKYNKCSRWFKSNKAVDG